MPRHTFTALCQTTTARKISPSKLVIGLDNCVKQLMENQQKNYFRDIFPNDTRGITLTIDMQK